MRLTVSLPDGLGEALKARAESESRPVSNMVAVLLYAALADPPQTGTATITGPHVFRGPDPKVKK